MERFDDSGGKTYYFDIYGSYTFGTGINPPEDLTVQEFEVNVQREGDMEAQFPEQCGHNPLPFMSNYFVASGAGGKIMDFISFTMNTTAGPCRNGKATWNIPTRFRSKQDQSWSKTINIAQEYILSNGTLTVLKGGCVLLELQVE